MSIPNNQGPQDWQLESVGRDYWRLVGRNSGYCADVENGSTTPGTNVRQWNCNNMAAQIWRFERR